MRGRGREALLEREVLSNAGRLLFAVLLCILLVSRYTAVARTGYEIARLKAQIEGLRQENQRLQMTVAELESFKRIEKTALAALGMKRPEEVRYVTLPGATGHEYLASSSDQGPAGQDQRARGMLWPARRAEAGNGRLTRQ